MFFVPRAEFYTDLVAITNNVVATSSDTNIVATKTVSTLSSEIANVYTAPSNYSSNTLLGNGADESILTDTASTVFDLISQPELTHTSKTSRSGTTTSFAFETTSTYTLKHLNVSSSSASTRSHSTYANNAEGSTANIKRNILIWGLVSFSFIWSLF